MLILLGSAAVSSIFPSPSNRGGAPLFVFPQPHVNKWQPTERKHPWLSISVFSLILHPFSSIFEDSRIVRLLRIL